MSLDANQLYALLPAIYRTRDAENGEPLKALMTLLAGQAAVLEEDIRQLYDDEFIETCAPWVIPYIGELVGCDPIYEVSQAVSGRRAEVANTIGYRRRKGTLLALEQVAMDVSGLPAAAVEFFKRVITTESMRHLRLYHSATVDLRHAGQIEKLNTAFDILNRTVDVRRIAPRVRAVTDPDPTALDINLHGGGRFNIPDVGIYLWRWKPFGVTGAPAHRVDHGRFKFSPLGQDIPLFNGLAARDSFSRLTTRLDVSQPITRREFSRNIQKFYGPGNSIEILLGGVAIPASQICCQNLADRPSKGWGCTPPGKIGIDPELGRIQFAAGFPVPQFVQVNYYYGFPAEIGGGPYDRTASLSAVDPSQSLVVGSSQTPTLEDAVAAWNQKPAGSKGLIILRGFASLQVNLTGNAAIVLPAQSQLWIVSADANPTNQNEFTYVDSCVTLHGNIEVRAAASGSAGATNDGAAAAVLPQLILSGVWMSGSVNVLSGPANVQLMDCTFVPGIGLAADGSALFPGNPSLIVSSGEVSLALLRCITGPIAASVEGTTRICSSIVDSASRCAVAYAAPDMASEGGDLHIEDSTVIGKVHVHLLELASNTIFLARLARHDSWSAALWCSRQQAGCVRFCFLPTPAITPRRYRCLPPDATFGAVSPCALVVSPNLDPASAEGQYMPKFVSLQFGSPSYCLLSGDTPMAVWTGADNASQMGVYWFLQETEAVRNVQLQAPEFLPFGLEDGVFLVPSRTEILRPLLVPYGYGQRILDPCGDQAEDDLRFVSVGAALI